MTKSSDLLNIKDLCKFYGLSVQTIRRRIREAKEGTGSFPRPVFGYGKKALWHWEDILNYRAAESEQDKQEQQIH